MSRKYQTARCGAEREVIIVRLKEIKPGMVIHCKNDEEKKMLLEEAERLGYRWYDAPECPLERNTCSGMTIHFNEPSYGCDYLNVSWSSTKKGVTEFSDLVIPDSELSAEEALLAYDQMCKENYRCNDCPIYGIVGNECTHKMEGHISEIVDAIKKWKADHEKKEPKIETVDTCRIIEIQPDGRKRCVYEEDIKPDPDLPYGSEQIAVEQILKRYCMEHDGEFIAVHEVVSRVKAVE